MRVLASEPGHTDVHGAKQKLFVGLRSDLVSLEGEDEFYAGIVTANLKLPG